MGISHAINNNNTETCKAHKVISNSESEVLAVARWTVLTGYVER